MSNKYGLPAPNELLNSMEAIKLTKLGTFLVISIIDSKLISKLPKCMLVFFSLLNQAKYSFKVHEHFFPLITPDFGHNIRNSPMIIIKIFYISFHKITQNAPMSSLTHIFKPNNPFCSHMEIFIIHPLWQKLHIIHLQATNTSNIHILSLSLIHI